jgi:hypothetical protein
MTDDNFGKTPEGDSFVNTQQGGESSFYNDAGQVADPNDAWEMAAQEDTLLKVEERLKTEHEEGLTVEQKENLEVADLLREEFPNAILERIDAQTGEKYYLTGIKNLPKGRNPQVPGEIISQYNNIRELIEHDPQLRSVLEGGDSIAIEIGEFPRICKYGILTERGKFSYSSLNPQRQEQFLQVIAVLENLGKAYKEETELPLKEKVRIIKNAFGIE